MNINRHNYETFFLLYIDQELTGEERAMVEAFVTAHPDLKEELLLLEQTRLKPDGQLEPAFLQSLLRVEEELSADELEWALLEVDQELTGSETEKLERSLQNNPALQRELELLKKTKLQPDASVVFPDKSLLYRKEQQPGIVISLSSLTRRFAAAAAVILLLGTGMWLFFRQDPAQSPVALKGNNNQNTAPVTPGNPVTAEKEPGTDSKTNAAPDNPTAALATVVRGNGQQPAPANHALVSNAKGEEVVIITSPEEQETLIVQTTPEPTEKKSELTSNISSTSTVPSVTNTASNTSFASYNPAEEDAGEDEEGFLNEEQQRRSGLKGFIKKAKRTFERRTGINSGESQVRFAVFAVSTK